VCCGCPAGSTAIDQNWLGAVHAVGLQTKREMEVSAPNMNSNIFR